MNVGGIVETCGVLTFGADSACGQPLLVYNIPFDSLFTALATNRRSVGYHLAGDTLIFGGAMYTGTKAGSCNLSGDDGTVYGTLLRQEKDWAGEWGILSYASAGPIGHLVMKRRWKQ